MNNDEEPITFMARTMYELFHEHGDTLHSWDDSSPDTRLSWEIIAARGLNAFWDQRERLHNAPVRSQPWSQESPR